MRGDAGMVRPRERSHVLALVNIVYIVGLLNIDSNVSPVGDNRLRVW